MKVNRLVTGVLFILLISSVLISGCIEDETPEDEKEDEYTIYDMNITLEPPFEERIDCNMLLDDNDDLHFIWRTEEPGTHYSEVWYTKYHANETVDTKTRGIVLEATFSLRVQSRFPSYRPTVRR